MMPGFTLIEVLIALALSGLVLTGAMRLLLTILQRDAMSAEHVRIISEGQKMADFLRTTTRLTSLQEMRLFPEPGPHNAVSYPLPPADMPVQNQTVGSDGYVDWGETVIIHAWPPQNSTEMRMTRFRPRDNSLTPEERMEQLEHVSTTGGGAATHNGSNASTLTLARVQADFSVRTAMSGYNFYAPNDTLDPNMYVGSIRLLSRENRIRFRVTGNASQSSGHDLTLDRFFLSPSGLSIEAEALMPPWDESGASAYLVERVGAGWSGERAVRFPAAAAGAEVELTYFNDTWHEEWFLRRGAEFEKSVSELRTDPGFMGQWLRPAGRELAWFAPFQTDGDGESAPLPASLNGAAVRTVLRGRQAGDHITATGDGVRVTFRAGDEAGKGMHIIWAFISEAADHSSPKQQINTATTYQVRFGDPDAPEDSVFILSQEEATSVPLDFPIDPEKSYVVSYSLGSSFSGGTSPGYPAWFPDAARRDTYIIPGSALPGAADPQRLTVLQLADWDTYAALYDEPGILGTAELNTTYFDEAVYTSRIVDTTLEAPQLKIFRHESEIPDDTTLTFRVRSCSTPDLSLASDWSSAFELPLNGTIDRAKSRYLQVQVRMTRDKVRDVIPRVRNFTLSWPGQERTLDFGGAFVRTARGGIADILVNDQPPATSFRAEIQLTGDEVARSPVPGARDWSINVETTPRNR
jgi:prepilin-type N-terminal cleavage/methylation domain-containing protein